LLFRVLAEGGVDEVRRAARLHEPRCSVRVQERPYLITGGAGFIGTNLAHRLLSQKKNVLLYDNLSRPGVEKNVDWLRKMHGNRVGIELADIRDFYSLRNAVECAQAVFHLAAQVAVTTSLVDPLVDFEVNVRGTFNILEVLRSLKQPPPLLFTSTNKVYGSLLQVKLTRNGSRYEPPEDFFGVGENWPLDFHSPYGCSKGSADQYVLDYARIYGLPAVVFRMSCI
jgi:CDP-paratose 2-epimerase